MQFEEQICCKFSDAVAVADVPKQNNICPAVQHAINNIIRNENYLNYRIYTKPISFNGGNFLGDLMEITIEDKTDTEVKENHIFVKHIPEEGILAGVIHIDQCYLREVFMYETLHTIYDELYDDSKVPQSERLKQVKCYDSNDHVIIMDNLSQKGFKVLNRMDIVSLQFAEAAIKQIAKFHALSFVLEHKNSEYFEKEIKTLKTPFIFGDIWKNTITTMIKVAYECIDSDLKYNKDAIIDMTLHRYPKYLTGQIGLVRCLCHGDFRINNILTKENDDNKTEAVIIDYQTMNYNSPIIDFLYFIYTGTDREFRRNHLEHLKDLYHNTLTKHLQMFQLDIDAILPRSLFEKEFKECLDYSLLLAVILLPCVLTDDPDMLKNEAKVKLNETLRNRINEIFQEYTEWGLVRF